MKSFIIVALIGQTLNLAAAGPLGQVFNEQTIVMAFFGMLGGFTFYISGNGALSQVARPAFLGAALAMGLGVLAPAILSKALGITLEGEGVNTLASGAYTVGLVQERLLAWLNAKKGDRE